jgi:hypothetical protein
MRSYVIVEDSVEFEVDFEARAGLAELIRWWASSAPESAKGLSLFGEWTLPGGGVEWLEEYYIGREQLEASNAAADVEAMMRQMQDELSAEMRREAAHEAGMCMGIDAYNDVYGYSLEDCDGCDDWGLEDEY